MHEYTALITGNAHDENREMYLQENTGELLASDAEYARTYYHYASDEMGSITHVVAGLEKEAAVDGQGNDSVWAEQDNQPAERGEVPENSILNRYEYDAWGT